jgi:hypothetical protein
MTPGLCEEPGEGEEGHEGEGTEAALYLELDLILEEARVAHHVVVEYEGVGEGSEQEVEDVYADESDDGERYDLARQMVPWP